MHVLIRTLALQDAVSQQQAETILAPAHLLAILLTEDKQRGSATAFVRNVHDEGTAKSRGACRCITLLDEQREPCTTTHLPRLLLLTWLSVLLWA